MIIIDDESWVRERVKDTIDWSKMGVELVGEACDGKEALKLIDELNPGIILTDIRMPCIDGLEFVRILRQKGSAAKVIIISGYSDFEYAREAIKLGAFDYILKPFEDDDLTSAVKGCTRELDRLKLREALLEKAGEQIKDSFPILKEKFLMNLINGYFRSEQQLNNSLEYLGQWYEGHSYICFIAQIDKLETPEMEEGEDRHLAQFVVCNIARDFAEKIGKSEMLILHSGEIICLISSGKSGDILASQVMSISNGIREMVRKVMNFTVTIGIGRTCSTLLDIAFSYQEAKQVIQFKTYFGSDRSYDIRSLDINLRSGSNKPYDMEALINSIKMGNKENALKSLDAVVSKISEADDKLLPIDLKLLFIDITNQIFKIILEDTSLIEEYSAFGLSFLNQLSKLQNVVEMYSWLKDTIVKIINCLEKSANNRKRKVIEKAIEYIGNHYKEPITLKDISEKLYLNASYFCKIFREEMGESFTRYLMRLRIQKAIEIMDDPTVKIYEIADRVGYNDVQYFTKIFKSFQGVAPMQYREKIK